MLVGTVTDDVRVHEVPKMKVCALRFTENARARILKVGLYMRTPMLLVCCQVRSLIGSSHNSSAASIPAAAGSTGSSPGMNSDVEQTAQLLLAQAAEAGAWQH